MTFQPALWLALALAAAGAAYGLIGASLVWLRVHAVAHLNHRTLHAKPTPQGAGLIVVPVALAVIAIAVGLGAPAAVGGTQHILAVALAALGLVGVGFLDDTRAMPPWVKLVGQMLAAALVVLTLPSTSRLLPELVPLAAERALLFIAVVWFINLMNFMDGMDWMSAVETVAISVGVLLLAAFGVVPASLGWCAAAILGAMLGFMPWNAPVARVFLGDAGSLPLGLLMATLLMHIAASGAWTAALILPLYYLADATITLVRRVARGARPWEAHREHFYQRAHAGGLTVQGVICRVALLNTALLVLAILSALFTTWSVTVVVVAASAGLVLWTLWELAGER